MTALKKTALFTTLAIALTLAIGPATAVHAFTVSAYSNGAEMWGSPQATVPKTHTKNNASANHQSKGAREDLKVIMDGVKSLNSGRVR